MLDYDSEEMLRSRIKQRMKERGITVKELAHSLSIAEGTLCNKLYSFTQFKAWEVAEISTILHCSTDYLFGMKEMTDEDFHEFVDNAYFAEFINGNIVLKRITEHTLLAAASKILKQKGKL